MALSTHLQYVWTMVFVQSGFRKSLKMKQGMITHSRILRIDCEHSTVAVRRHFEPTDKPKGLQQLELLKTDGLIRTVPDFQQCFSVI